MTTYADSPLRKKYAALLGPKHHLRGLTKNESYYVLIFMDRFAHVHYRVRFESLTEIPDRVLVETMSRVGPTSWHWRIEFYRYVPGIGVTFSVTGGRASYASKSSVFKRGREWFRYVLTFGFPITTAWRKRIGLELDARAREDTDNPLFPGYVVNPRNRGASSTRLTAPLRPSSETKTRTFVTQTETNTSPGTPGVSGAKVVYSRSWTGARTPNYGKLKASQLPINGHSVGLRFVNEGMAYSCSEWVAPQPPSYVTMTGGYTDIFELVNIPGAPTHSAVASNKAITRLVNKANAGLSGNVAQDIAQFTQMRRLIGGNFGRMTQTLGYLRKGNLPKAVSTLFHGTTPRYRDRGGPSISYSVARNWLELQYGWKPLLKDIQEAMKAAAGYFGQTLPLYTQKASAYVALSTNNKLYTGSTVPPVGTREIYTHSRCTIGIRWKVDDKLKVFMNQLGFTNPIALGWELLPWSFVLDWLLPIGPYLEALTNFDGLVFVDGFQTNFTKQHASLVIAFDGWDGVSNKANIKHFHGTYRERRIILNRVKLTTFPRNRLPSIKNPFSMVHALNALALLRVALRK